MSVDDPDLAKITLLGKNAGRFEELMGQPVWDIDDVALFFGVSKATVYRWNLRTDPKDKDKPWGPLYAKLGKHCKYDRDDVLAWFETMKLHEGPPDAPRKRGGS